MNSLHHLVAARKVLYLVSRGFSALRNYYYTHGIASQGVSDTPAWVVAKANTYARMAGKTPFVIY